jgi:hypothetical protein
MMHAVSRWPFALHIVYEGPAPNTQDGQREFAYIADLVALLYEDLCGSERAARVPVRFWRNQLRNAARVVPDRIPLEWAAKNVIVVVVDPCFFQRRSEWSTCITRLVADVKTRRDNDLIIPLSLGANAARMAEAFADVNHLAVEPSGDKVEDARTRQGICQAIYTSLHANDASPFTASAARAAPSICRS